MDQPNPEIRDDSYLNTVGGMNSEQPGEEANSAEGALHSLKPEGGRSNGRSLSFEIEKIKQNRQSTIILKLRETGSLSFLSVFYSFSVTYLGHITLGPLCPVTFFFFFSGLLVLFLSPPASHCPSKSY